MSPNPQHCCLSCTAWVPFHTGKWGHCKALPPIAIRVTPDTDGEAHWPEVKAGDWCRDGFQPKTGDAQ